MRYLLPLVALLIALHSLAMQCMPMEPENVIDNAGIIFTGRAIKQEASDYNPAGICWEDTGDGQCGGKVVTFEIDKVLIGEPQSTATVLIEDGCYCLGPYTTVGEHYLIVADANTTSFKADLLARNVCSGTSPLDSELAQRIINAFEVLD